MLEEECHVSTPREEKITSILGLEIGVFGTVFKVPLGSQQGRNVAIKKLITSNILQYPEDFDREVRIIGNARHPNLIALKGYYWTPQLQLLASEFAPNGNLQSKLHEKLPSSPPLSWPNRFKILLGTAKGLAHLHHSFRPPIIHCNIKPSNILLDENFNAKISDFGLARLLSKLDKHVMSNRFQSALGYVAPELACQSLRMVQYGNPGNSLLQELNRDEEIQENFGIDDDFDTDDRQAWINATRWQPDPVEADPSKGSRHQRKMVCIADPPYDKSLQQPQSILSSLVSEEKLELRYGLYSLK
ncbi:leucine-rich receptor-like kinase family protein [Medicago truncatula]|uniref:non-specific serine/threonine protein kinase n=1 Tax=Medicago truncatula TaxID=3880 RepID=A0A072THK3_MEDTR|nr:leucine-rich receptor-like kinase family protein [Medicago truncatula]